MKETKKDPIVLTDTDTKETYTLEFSRTTVRQAENSGFSVENIISKPLSAVYDLWYYAFLKNHPRIGRVRADELLDKLGGVYALPEGLLERLIDLYKAPFVVFNDEDNGKNARATVKF